MMSRVFLGRCLSLVAVALSLPCLLGGCGAGDHPDTYPVGGVVTLNGQPVAEATVNFFPVAEGQSSVGRTDAQGRYELTTFDPGDGALPGEYQVAISKYELPSGAADVDTEPSEEGSSDPESLVPQNVLPERYASPQTSELRATVSEGTNRLDFELQGG